MNRLFLGGAIASSLFLAVGCHPGMTISTEQAFADTTTYTLIGKTLILDYGTMKAEVRYGQDTLSWKTFSPEGDQTGQDNEIPAYEALGNGRFFATWQEADGTAVTQIVDLKEHTILASVLDPAQAKSNNRTPLVLVGTAQEVPQSAK